MKYLADKGVTHFWLDNNFYNEVSQALLYEKLGERDSTGVSRSGWADP
jgi:hypothetical protein